MVQIYKKSFFLSFFNIFQILFVLYFTIRAGRIGRGRHQYSRSPECHSRPRRSRYRRCDGVAPDARLLLVLRIRNRIDRSLRRGPHRGHRARARTLPAYHQSPHPHKKGRGAPYPCGSHGERGKRFRTFHTASPSQRSGHGRAAGTPRGRCRARRCRAE